MRFFTKLLLFTLTASVAFNAYTIYKDQQARNHPITVVVGEPVVMRTNGGLLEVATIKNAERFEQASSSTILGISVPTTSTVATIQVPVTYRYHVPLATEWRFFRRDNVFVVVAPPVKPSLPVAIDTTGLQSFSHGTWSLITGRAATDDLLKQLTPLLNDRANASAYIEAQRDAARKTVGEFVQKWVLSQDKWKNLTGVRIQVFFADEPTEKMQAAGYALAPYKL